MKVAVVVRIEPLDVEAGHWCDACALPSAFRVAWAIVRRDDVPLAAGSRLWCPECKS